MNKKLLKAKSNWIKFMCEYYFEEKDEGFLPEKNEREEFFLYYAQKALKLNEKDFIDYIISEGWVPTISEAYERYFEDESLGAKFDIDEN